jgi:uncharacterized protein (TIGR00297 family)
MHRLWIAAAVTLAFAALARILRGVTTSGAIAGGVVSFALYACAGPGAFAVLVSVFALTWVATRWGYPRKQRLGIAERRSGRDASQVLANLAVSAICAGAYFYGNRSSFLVATAAALAEAAADTVSSEIGQASGRSNYLITSWEPVATGTDGGISLAGTVAGVISAFLVGLVCCGVGLLSWKLSLLVGTAGVIGMLADSYLGAVFERQHRLNNDLVNLFSTSIAAGIALVLAKL